jgi:hypothetical protein
MRLTREQIMSMAQAAGLSGETAIFTSSPYITSEVEKIAQAAYKAGMDAEAKRLLDKGTVSIGHMREQIKKERVACAKLCKDANNAHGDFDYAGEILKRGEV